MRIKRLANGSLLRACAMTALATSLLGTVGCTTAPVSSVAIADVVMPIEYRDNSGKPVGASLNDSALWLGTIPGELYGNTQSQFRMLGIGASPGVAIPSAELERFSAKHASRLTPKAFSAGFRVMPVDTRFARIATGFLTRDPVWQSASTGLADSTNKKILTLVYFDRACHLSGQAIAVPGTRTDGYDIVIERPGLQLLETTKVSDSHWEIRQAPESARPMLTVRTR